MSKPVWRSQRMALKYHRDPFMVSCCLSDGLVVHVQFWSNLDRAQQGDFVEKMFSECVSDRPEYSIFCRIHDLYNYACASLVQWRCSWAKRGGHCLKSTPSPCWGLNNMFSTYRMHQSDLQRCMKKFFLSVPFPSEHLDALCHFLSF